ncbi:unnamed protein product [Paramecium sonneborni]|uniref:Uncharacterized protein n=1 Tax=Paramecium sonneborni TaxID=65129 RepID=A0A8S1R005_9CILI|nr:unnamed protein product [Paramecium sonneborni]
MYQSDNNLDKLFELFKDQKTKLFQVESFITSLEQTEMTQNTLILKERLNLFKKQQLSKAEFEQLFQIDLKNRDMSQAIFNSIQKKDKNFISTQDLINLNQLYKFGYTNDQINLIMKFLGKSNQISNDQFIHVLQQQQHN